jgi:mRNA-degrading endonuclease toxin of MazEF toxin-antitoxin module
VAAHFRGHRFSSPCAINLDSIVTIAKAHLKRRIAPLSPDKLVAAEQALRFALALVPLDAPR